MNDSVETDASNRDPAEHAPPSRGRSLSSDVPALALVWPLAIVAAMAMILGRVVGPASTGLVVGFGGVTRAIELAGAIATQVLAMAATVVTMAEVISASRSGIPVVIRLGAIAVGGFGIIVGLSAAVLRVPGTSAAILGVSASIFAVAAAWDASRAPFARPFAIVLGVLAAAGLVHLAAAGISELATARASLRLAEIARVVATAAFLIDAAALLGAMTILASGTKKLTSPITLVALVVAFILTRQALLGDADDASVASALLRRAADRLTSRPDPFLPPALRTFICFLAPIAAVGALFVRGQLPALVGALALALLARGAPDMPLGGMLMIIASLTMALAARDDRGVWASIIAGRSVKPAGPSSPDARPGSADGQPIDVPPPPNGAA